MSAKSWGLNGELMDFEIESPLSGTGYTSGIEQLVLPKIYSKNRFLADVSAETLSTLLAQNEPPLTFKRAGMLYRIKEIDSSKAAMEAVDVHMMLGMMARSALFLDEKDNPMFPPDKVSRDILSMPSWPFPDLMGIVSTPVLCSNGRVITEPGYDEASCLFYKPAADLVVPEISDQPAQSDAASAAKYLLEEVFADFPYRDQASRANVLAALLTPIVRPIIDGCTPLFLFDKPAPGSGATLQTEIISWIVTGEPADLKKQSSSDEEMRKQITSWLIPGPQILVIDNIDTKVCAASLSSALTCRLWGDRLLGHSKSVSLPNVACWYATGNNIQLGGDIPRRSCLIRIDAGIAKPWERKTDEFRHPKIIEWVRANRGKILANALTMTRAWVVAGRPSGSAQPIGGFESWTDTLSGILEYAGVTGLLENSKTMMAMDLGTEEWEIFLKKWLAILGSEPILMRVLLKELWKDKELAEVMPEEIADSIRGAKTAGAGIKVGKALARKAGVTYPNGLRIIKGKDAHSGQKTWAVETRVVA